MMTKLEAYFSDVLETIEELAEDELLKEDVLLKMIKKECAIALRGDDFDEEEM